MPAEFDAYLADVVGDFAMPEFMPLLQTELTIYIRVSTFARKDHKFFKFFGQFQIKSAS